MKPMIYIHDCETGETTTREMTEEEYAEILFTGLIPDEPTEP
jgi:hypothetical protein